MKDLKTEYKVAIIIISIMVVLLVVVLITTGSFEKLFLKYKKDSLINCTSERIEEKLNYVSTKCVIKDESDNTYQLSYPKFENNTINLNNINNSFKNSYELFIKEIQYKGEDKSLSIQLMQQLNYKIINYSNYYFVIKIINRKYDTGFEFDYNYIVYVIDLDSNKVLTNKEFYKKITKSENLSSKLRRKMIDLYQIEFGYNISNPNHRVDKVDEFYLNLSASNIDTYYYDNSGNLSFILNIYDPNRTIYIPYFFKATIDGDISYSKVFL